MATIKKIEDIECWKLARQLAKEVFEVSLEGPFSKDYKLRNQIWDSTGSVMDNIAEGFGRGGTSEFIHFLSIAKGSACEAKSQIYRAFDRRYITKEKQDSLLALASKTIIKINNFTTYLRGLEHKGIKFLRK